MLSFVVYRGSSSVLALSSAPTFTVARLSGWSFLLLNTRSTLHCWCPIIPRNPFCRQPAGPKTAFRTAHATTAKRERAQTSWGLWDGVHSTGSVFIAFHGKSSCPAIEGHCQRACNSSKTTGCGTLIRNQRTQHWWDARGLLSSAVERSFIPFDAVQTAISIHSANGNAVP